jgi:hypothetical protein
MINEPVLRETLIALAGHAKSQYVMLSSTLNEVAALRETVRGLDPTFSEVLEDRRENQAKQSAEVVSQTIRLLDDLIRVLRDRGVC